jgi:hypothetical protein
MVAYRVKLNNQFCGTFLQNDGLEMQSALDEIKKGK